MKKLVLASSLAMVLSADVVTVLPFLSYINYDGSSSKSIKDNAKYGGIYANVGNLGYLFEVSYSYLDTKYKDSSISNLKQHDITAVYGKYFKNFMFKLGMHYISNNENKSYIDLGGGYIGIAGIGGYHWVGYDKISYGLDGYYSSYKDGKNDDLSNQKTGMTIYQASPYFTYSKAIDINTRDTFSVKLNYIYAPQYKSKSYTSFEIFNTLLYKSFYNTLRYMGGKSKSGVFNGGFVVFNSKDTLTQAFDVTLGYYFTPALTLDLTYSYLKYDEYWIASKDATRASYTATMSYRF